MKAILRTRYGGVEVLEVGTCKKPRPASEEVLVRVHATTVNRTDCAILSGKPFLTRFLTGFPRPSSKIPGTDFAGEIEAVGERVTDLEVGDRVWGFDDEGLASQAEYLTIGVNRAVVRVPEKLNYEEVVACAEGAHYAYNFINKCAIKKGAKVLVNGATGAIGSATVQLLNAMGAYVVAVGNTPNLELVKRLGAERVIDYLKEDFTKDKEQYHFIFDAVGKSTFYKCKHLLLPGGVYMSSELGPYAQNIYLHFFTRIFNKKRVVFPIPQNCRRSILFLTELIEQGRFKAVIDRTYSMDEIRKAYEYVAKGGKTGNVIITY